jgi:hypothetical protein
MTTVFEKMEMNQYKSFLLEMERVDDMQVSSTLP